MDPCENGCPADEDWDETDAEDCSCCGCCCCCCPEACTARIPKYLACSGADNECCGQDVCGVLCVGLSWFVLAFCSATVTFALHDVSPSFLAIYLTVVALATVSHIKAVRCDPGFQPKGLGRDKWAEIREKVLNTTKEKLLEKKRIAQEENESAQSFRTVKQSDGTFVQELEPTRVRAVMSDKEVEFRCLRAIDRKRREIRYCDVCESFKESGTHHCSVCKRCVARMDHHCPWVNNCVGEKSLRYFLLFLLYVLISSLMSLCIFFYRAFLVVTTPSPPMFGVDERGVLTRLPQHRDESSPWPLVTCILSVIMCCFFCVFVIAMGCEQYDALSTGLPGIDKLKKEGEEVHLGLYRGLQRFACGGRSLSIWWFLPFEPPSPVQKDRMDKTD